MIDGKHWRCPLCGFVLNEDERLQGPSPFDEHEVVYGCPRCREVIVAFEYLCDEPGCVTVSSFGTPTDNGYRYTCGRHVPKARQSNV